MNENEFARAALVNLLLRGCHRYQAATKNLVSGSLKDGLLRLSAARVELAHSIANEGDPISFDESLRPEDDDDAARRATAGREAIYELVFKVEAELGETLEDLPAATVGAEVLERLRSSLQAANAWIKSEALTLRANWEDSSDGAGFVVHRGRPAGPSSTAPQPHTYQVWFGTNRRPMSTGSRTGFGSERDDHIHLGRCEVVIPQAHRIGSVGSRWWYRIVHGDDRLRLRDVRQMAEADFWKSVAEKVAKEGKADDAIVFIHGYNVSFEDAAIRAAQIGADLSIPGAMAFFSWPSCGRLLRYPADEARIEASEAQITQFLIDFAERAQARRVHIIAHSMGNRGLLRAVNRIAAAASVGTPKRLGQIILAAPDVDSDIFRQLAGAFARVATRTTLYVSRGDLAVCGSRLFHSAPRIGFAPPLAIVDGIDTVNVTNIDLTLLGHGYVAESRSVLTDMHQLVTTGAAPESRPMLRRINTADREFYWEFAA